MSQMSGNKVIFQPSSCNLCRQLPPLPPIGLDLAFPSQCLQGLSILRPGASDRDLRSVQLLTCMYIQGETDDKFRGKTWIVPGFGAGTQAEGAILKGRSEWRKAHLNFPMGWADSGAAGAWVAVGSFSALLRL